MKQSERDRTLPSREDVREWLANCNPLQPLEPGDKRYYDLGAPLAEPASTTSPVSLGFESGSSNQKTMPTSDQLSPDLVAWQQIKRCETQEELIEPFTTIMARLAARARGR